MDATTTRKKPATPRGSLDTVTTSASPGGTGSRARARTERPPRCERPKVENGRPCKRGAGAGTDHAGQGPCSLHDDGSWQAPSFAENREAQEAFLAAVREQPGAGIRDLVEPLGYHRRDVEQLREQDQLFADAYVEARGLDVDTLWNAARKRAIEEGSDRLLEFLLKVRTPEGQALQQHRLDGRLEVSQVEVKLAFEPRFDQPAGGLDDGVRRELEP